MSASARSSKNCSVIALADAPRLCRRTRCCSAWKRSNRSRRTVKPRLKRPTQPNEPDGLPSGRMNRGSLPAHLPRVEMVVDIDDPTCPCCGKALHRIGEDTSERLDIAGAVPCARRPPPPKYACRACENVVQAPAPARLIEGGLAHRGDRGAGARVQVCRSTGRRRSMPGRASISTRSTLADWVGRAASMLRPVHDRLLSVLKSSVKLFADETTAAVARSGARAHQDWSALGVRT